jgi:putative ABC transport system permease protein
MARDRFAAILIGFIAALALAVATIGIYSMMDYAVSERIREIGIHLTLGAQRRDVFWQMMTHGMTLVPAGW